MSNHRDPRIYVGGGLIQPRVSTVHGGTFLRGLEISAECLICGGIVEMDMNAFYIERFKFDAPNKIWFVCCNRHDTEAWLTVSSGLDKVLLEVTP